MGDVMTKLHNMNNSIVKLLLVCAIVVGAITLVRCDTNNPPPNASNSSPADPQGIAKGISNAPNVLPTIDPRKITLPSNGLVATWEVVVTNLPPPPGMQGMEEYTVIQGGREVHVQPMVEWSNVVARLLWKNNKVEWVLESNAIRVVNRSYVIEAVKHYQ